MMPGIEKLPGRSRLLAAIALCLFSTAIFSAETVPSNSLYNLHVALENQSAEAVGLDVYRGQPVLVTMFYASCPHVCPLLISTIKVTESKLTAEERSNLRVLTISVDPERDKPALLQQTMERHAVDSSRWMMARPAANDLRKIAGALGIRYKALPDGEFNHSTRIVLLDSAGRIVSHTEQLGRHDPAFLEAIKKSLQ